MIKSLLIFFTYLLISSVANYAAISYSHVLASPTILPASDTIRRTLSWDLDNQWLVVVPEEIDGGDLDNRRLVVVPKKIDDDLEKFYRVIEELKALMDKDPWRTSVFGDAIDKASTIIRSYWNQGKWLDISCMDTFILLIDTYITNRKLLQKHTPLDHLLDDKAINKESLTDVFWYAIACSMENDRLLKAFFAAGLRITDERLSYKPLEKYPVGGSFKFYIEQLQEKTLVECLDVGPIVEDALPAQQTGCLCIIL